jgi:hypothetical protein
MTLCRMASSSQAISQTMSALRHGALSSPASNSCEATYCDEGFPSENMARNNGWEVAFMKSQVDMLDNTAMPEGNPGPCQSHPDMFFVPSLFETSVSGQLLQNERIVSVWWI